MKTVMLFSLLLLTTLLTISCSNSSGNSIVAPRHFSLPSSEYSQLRTQSSALKLGMSEAQVVSLLGHPTIRYVEAPKTEISPGVSKIVFIYDVERNDIGTVHDSDKYLRIEFSSTDKELTAVQPRNLPEFNAISEK